MTHVADVTVPSTSVSEDHSGFIVTIDLSDLDGVGDFWNTVASGGGDIRCYKSDGTTQLARHVISCTPLTATTGTGTIKVKFSGTLSSTANNVIQIHADGVSAEPGAATTYGKNAVYSDDGCRLHFLADLVDDTGNNTFTAVDTGRDPALGSAPPALFGNDGIGDTTCAGFSPGSGYTITMDANFLNLSNWDAVCGGWSGLEASPKSYPSLWQESTGSIMRVYHETATTNGNWSLATGWSGIEGAGRGLVQIVWDGANTISVYRNGTLQTSNSSPTGNTALDSPNGNLFTIGCGVENAGVYRYTNDLDLWEYGFTNVARSANWIADEYANRNSPGTFYSVAAAGTIHALLADDVESASEVTAPAITQVHALLANDVESTTELTAPSINSTNALLAEDIESAVEVSAPALTQNVVHNLLANDVESAVNLSTPALAEVAAGGTADLVIDATQIGTDLTNYVLFIPEDQLPASLKTNNGADIRVYESDNITELARHIMGFGTTHPRRGVYVRVPGTLSSTINTTIKLSANGVASDYADTDTYGRNAVWQDYTAVLFLNNDLVDSTGNNTFAASGTTANFTQNVGSIVLGGSVGLTATSATGWDISTGYAFMLAEANFSVTASQVDWYRLFEFNGENLSVYRSGGTSFGRWDHGSHANVGGLADAISSGVSERQDYVWDTSNYLTYVDGVGEFGPTAYAQVPSTSATIDLFHSGGGVEAMVGTVYGPIKIANFTPSADFIATEYLNETAPTTLFTITDTSSTVDNLLADDVESATELTAPSMTQVHALLANDIESAVELTAPVLSEPLPENAVKSVAVNSDGWTIDVEFANWGPEIGDVVYDFGNPDAGAGNMTLTVTSEGYNSSGVLGTVERTVYATAVVRKAYPNQASLDEAISGANLIVRMALSEPIYADDKNGGAGTSGTNPTVTVAQGFAEHSTTTPNSAVTGLVVTNNSTLDYPKVIGQWDLARTPAQMRVEGAFDVAFRARHGFGIAAVTLSATGDTSTNVDSGTVTALSTEQRQNGLYSESYVHNVSSLASFTQAENITLRAIAYPVVGDADSILDTADTTTAADDIRGLSELKVTCDKTEALKSYGVVTTTGNDGTGVVSTTLATAEASPYATVGAALEDGATVVYVRTGNHDILGSSPATVTALDYYREVRPHPSDLASGIALQRGGTHTQYKASKLAYIGFSGGIEADVTNQGGLDGEGTGRLRFQDCTFVSTFPPAAGLGDDAQGCWFVDCDGMGGDDYRHNGTDRVAYSFTGCTFSDQLSTNSAYTLIGCDQTYADGTARFDEKPTFNVAPTQNNVMIEHNKFMDLDQVSDLVRLGEVSNLSNISVIGNIIERTGTSASNVCALWLGGQGSAATLEHVIVAHNTIVGSPVEMFWNESGAGALSRTNVFVVGNAGQSYTIGSDVTNPEDSSRTGNWAQLYGVGYKDNRWDGTNDASRINEYEGINTSFVDAAVAIYGEITYTNDASVDGTGLGNGNYKPTDAELISQNTHLTYIGFSVDGDVASSNIGAIQDASTVDALLADDVESATEVTTPAIGQVHQLTQEGIESASEVTAPAVGQVHILLAEDIESFSEVTAPAFNVVRVLLAEDVESAVEVSAPVLGIGADHQLFAEDVESAVEVSTPALTNARSEKGRTQGPIPSAPPRNRTLSVAALALAIDGPERAYSSYRFSNGSKIEKPGHNPFEDL